MNKILTVSDNKVIVDEVILGIPEFKEMYDYFLTNYDEDTMIKAFSYLHFMYDLESPYRNLPEEEKEDTIKSDFGGKYRPYFDAKFIKAKDKMIQLSSTPIERMLEGLKSSMDKIAFFLANTEITSGKEGNIVEITNLHKSSALILKNYTAVEADFKKDVSKSRSSSRKAIDDEDTSSHF